MYIAYVSCMAYEFRKPHRSLQRVYEITGRFRLSAMTWCSAESGCTLVHIVYNVLQDLKVCVQFMYTAYGSSTAYQFRKPYRYIQHVYEIVVRFRSCHDLVYCREQLHTHTPSVQCRMGPPILYTVYVHSLW